MLKVRAYKLVLKADFSFFVQENVDTYTFIIFVLIKSFICKQYVKITRNVIDYFCGGVNFLMTFRKNLFQSVQIK